MFISNTKLDVEASLSTSDQMVGCKINETYYNPRLIIKDSLLFVSSAFPTAWNVISLHQLIPFKLIRIYTCVWLCLIWILWNKYLNKKKHFFFILSSQVSSNKRRSTHTRKLKCKKEIESTLLFNQCVEWNNVTIVNFQNMFTRCFCYFFLCLFSLSFSLFHRKIRTFNQYIWIWTSHLRIHVEREIPTKLFKKASLRRKPITLFNLKQRIKTKKKNDKMILIFSYKMNKFGRSSIEINLMFTWLSYLVMYTFRFIFLSMPFAGDKSNGYIKWYSWMAKIRRKKNSDYYMVET